MSVDKSSDKRAQEECYICGKLCEPSRILSHIRSHTNFMVYECEECGNRFASKKSLRQHSLTHQTHYICEVCNRKFGDPSRLVVHRCIDAKEKKYFCETCGKGFLHKNRLTRHISAHEEEKSSVSDANSAQSKDANENSPIEQQNENSVSVLYECDLCPKTFSTKRNLRRHRHLHTKEWAFTCKYCHKKFNQEDLLTAHISTHTDKLHKCELCGRTFNKKSNMHKHLLIHKRRESEKPVIKVKKEKFFICNLCFKNFSSKRNLQRHQVLHTNEKPYTCEVCHKSYASISYLKDHSFYHTNEKLFKCKYCDKSFYNNRLLGKHVKRHKDPSIFCSICGKGFYETVEYDRHFATHANIKPYICDICHKGFSLLLHLKRHYIWHTKVTIYPKKKDIEDGDNDANDLDVAEENSDEELIENFQINYEDQDDEKEDSKAVDPDDLDSTSENSDQDFMIENDNGDSEIEYTEEIYVDSNNVDVDSENNSQENILVKSDETEGKYTKTGLIDLFPVTVSRDLSTKEASDKIPSEEHNISRFKCRVCFELYESKGSLMEHSKIHEAPTINKPFVCFLKRVK